MAPPVPSGASQRLPQHQPQVAAPACSNTRPPWVPERLPDCVPGPRRDHTSIGVRPAADTIDPAAQSTRNKDCSIDPGCNIKEFDAPGPSGAMCSTLDRQVPLLLSGPGPAPVPDMSGMNGYWNAPFNFNMGVSMFHNTELDVKLSMDTIPGTDMFSAPGYGAHDLPVGPVFPGGNVVPLATASVVPQSGLQQPANRRRSAANNGNPQNIPLLCYACPKEPKFSDQSHLLTHIASKSHLSALFSLGLSDAGANKRRRERYDDWEKTYGIQALLKGRQETKELKKQDKRKRQRGNGNERTRRSASAQRPIKAEPDVNFGLPAHIDANPLNQNGWHMHTPRDSFANDVYQTPSNKRVRSVYPPPDTPQNASYIDEEAVTKGQGPNSATPKLKGSIWPGMSIFDSATPEMKRMRNQKKHGSVLENMAMNSQSIQQDEFVWDDQMFAITRTRNVYDDPSIDGSQASENDDAEEKPQKKRRARRAAPNVSAGQRQPRAAARGRTALRGSTRASTTGKKGGSKSFKTEPEPTSGEEQDPDGTHMPPNAAESGAGIMGGAFDGHTRGIAGIVGNPFNSEQKFSNNLQLRSAMNDLPSNRNMFSMFGRQDHPGPFASFGKDHDRAVFPVQQNSALSGYFNQQRQGMQEGVGNPLCVRPDSFNPYMFTQGFDASKPMASTPGFPAMNGMSYATLSGYPNAGMTNVMDNGMGNGLNGGQYQVGNGSSQIHGPPGSFQL